MIESDDKIDKIPNNIEAEKNLLGMLLSNNENMNRIGDVFKEEYFYIPLHNRIYEAINKLIDRGFIADPITIKNYFADEEIFKESNTTSYEYLLKIVTESTLNSDIKTLARSIYETYLRRKIIELGYDFTVKAKNETLEEKGEDLVEMMEQQLYDIASNTNYENRGVDLSESIKYALARIETASKNKSDISGVSTGYIELNKITGGFHNSDLIIVAGRPSMGKTALALNMALRAAKQFKEEHIKEKGKKKHVGFFSLEMSAEQLASRILSMETKIDGSKIRVGKVNKEEFKVLSKKVINLNDIPIIIDDTPALTISAIRTKARRMKRQYNLSFLVIDYLQLISGSKRNKENRVQEIAEISQGLKAIAKELDIAVLAASQLSRAVETRDDKRPMLSDLRESGNIEQDSDIVMFIYREEYYLSRKIPSSDENKLIEWQEKMEKVGNIAEIIIAKHRNGAVGNFSLRFDNKTTTFDDLA
ncbi:MAG: replicative DNA helicase [Candidatus Midichloriaceae bacterium]|jgi:replicative DNA helicase